MPELCNVNQLHWLENLWLKEKNSLTYKAAYTLMAFKQNDYKPVNKDLIGYTMKWLLDQQEDDGGFAPWHGHPVGSNIYCTSVSCLGLLCYPEYCSKEKINNAYKYMVDNQLKNGLWAYHELEDGGAWGLMAMCEIEKGEL